MSEREFIIRARSAPVDARRFREGVGSGPHVEFLAQILINALFVAQGHREDSVVHFVLEHSADFSRTLSFDGATLGSLGGLFEAAIISLFADTLDEARTLTKDERIRTSAGVGVRATSFEHLVKEQAGERRLVMLDPRGTALSEIELDRRMTFVLPDHVPMARKSSHWLERMGAERVSVGPRVLFASQCVTLVHAALDRAL